MKDLFGKALLDYYYSNHSEDLITATSMSLPEVLPLSYLFRSFDEMPELEKKALQLCEGKTLDVGCGSGIHSKYLIEQGIDVMSIDSSQAAIEICKSEGLDAQQLELLEATGKYNTILILMNGTGIFQTMDQVPLYLEKLKSLLSPDGQVLIDSSDVSYLYEGSGTMPSRLERPYYGELDYFISYKGESEDPMKWLYLDEETFRELCEKHALNFEVLAVGNHYDYLAKITKSIKNI